MAFIPNLFQIHHWPTSLLQQSHSSEYEFGTGGRHTKPCRACNDFQSWIQLNRGLKSTEKSTNAKDKSKYSIFGCLLIVFKLSFLIFL